MDNKLFVYPGVYKVKYIMLQMIVFSLSAAIQYINIDILITDFDLGKSWSVI